MKSHVVRGLFRAIVGLTFLVALSTVNVGCAGKNKSGCPLSGQKSAKKCCKKGAKCGADCKKPCCKTTKKCGSKKCAPDCKKPCCKKT